MDDPTNEEICNCDLGDPVFVNDNASWRHGSYRTEVYHRKSDGTYWQAKYRVSTDGETNELREGLATIVRVYPHQVMSTVYKTVPTGAEN